MDNNSNNLSSSILQSSETSFPSSTVASSSLSGDDSGFFDSFAGCALYATYHSKAKLAQLLNYPHFF